MLARRGTGHAWHQLGFLPQAMIGKRIRFKYEILDDEPEKPSKVPKPVS